MYKRELILWQNYATILLVGRYEIILKPDAINDMDNLSKYNAAIVADAIENYLSINPTFISKSRIKKLRGRQKADYRLRVGNYRVFYNVDEINKTVFILRVLHKNQTKSFYEEVF
jgi:mRNA-degrading endonuclease RelE of RelBE toxin-antitoxin system